MSVKFSWACESVILLPEDRLLGNADLGPVSESSKKPQLCFCFWLFPTVKQDRYLHFFSHLSSIIHNKNKQVINKNK